MIRLLLIKLLKNVGKQLVVMGVNALYRAIDKDHNGELSKDEIESFVSFIRTKLSRIKNKSQ